MSRPPGASSTKRYKRICKVCGGAFLAKRTKVMYCGESCRVKAYNIRKGKVLVGQRIKCKRCGIEITKTGKRHLYCADCRKVRHDLCCQQWRAAHPNYNNEWKAANADHVKQQRQAYYEKNLRSER